MVAYTGLAARGVFEVEQTRYDAVFASVEWAPGAAHRLRLAATFFRERSHYDESNLTPSEFALTRELTLANEDGVHLGPEDSLEIREPALFGRVPSHTLLSARVSFPLPPGA